MVEDVKSIWAKKTKKKEKKIEIKEKSKKKLEKKGGIIDLSLGQSR